MPSWTLLPFDEAGGAPTAVAATTLDGVLGAVAAHLRASRGAAKERVNLDALAEHCGQSYDGRSIEISDESFAGLREQLGLVAFVLRAPNGGDDAVILLADYDGALKGLPPNERANVICGACGLPYKVRGDVFIGRVTLGATGLELGADAAPGMAMGPGWAEAVKDANLAGITRKPASKIVDIIAPLLKMAAMRAKAAPAAALPRGYGSEAAVLPPVYRSGGNAAAGAAAAAAAAPAAPAPAAAAPEVPSLLTDHRRPVASHYARTAPVAAVAQTTGAGEVAPSADELRRLRLARFG